MPEGDTIHRMHARVAPILTGATLARVTTQGLIRGLDGRTVTTVEVHGKHLILSLDDGTQIRIHLGMYGRFRIYARAEGDAIVARTSPGRASLVVATATHTVIWLTAPTIEISHRRSPRHGMAIASLGPDILADDFDPAQVAGAARADPARAVGLVLLDQRIAAGIGNVYKCEALFVAGIDPRTPISTLDPSKLIEIYTAARDQMRANLGPGPRNTRSLTGAPRGDSERYAVYSRSGKPCLRCGTPIDCYSLGEPPRWTWSCPTCQPRPVAGQTDRR